MVGRIPFLVLAEAAEVLEYNLQVLFPFTYQEVQFSFPDLEWVGKQ